MEGEAEREEGEEGEEVSPVLVGRPLLCWQRTQRLQQAQTHLNWKQCDESIFLESGSQAFWQIPVWIKICVLPAAYPAAAPNTSQLQTQRCGPIESKSGPRIQAFRGIRVWIQVYTVLIPKF